MSDIVKFVQNINTGIDGNASQSAGGEARNLLVVRVHVEGCKVGLQAAVAEGQMRAYLVVP